MAEDLAAQATQAEQPARVAVVTGGSRGIGRACALRLAEAGCDIAVLYAGNDEAARETVEAVEALGAEVYSSVVIPRPHPDLKKITDRYRLENLLPY